MNEAERKKTVLVAGANGLLGRAMTARLTASEWNPVALTHADLDITDHDQVKAIIERIQPNIVINCAATADVDRCEREPDWAYAVNESGPRWLARFARRVGAEIVHVSTDYVFDGEKEGFYTQEDEPRPLSIYAKSKLAGERAAQSENERAYIIRTSWIFGAGGKNFGSRVIEYAQAGAHLKGVTDQTSIPTYAPDLAARIEEIIDKGLHGLYHITSTGATSWYDFARLALDMSGFDHVEIEKVTRSDLKQLAPRPRNSAMRCLLSERLGFAPLRHWKDTLPEFLDELSKQ
ncbi:MAG TPA: dTDP-4-dehydrorhamnose reductase [Blastocatellia bacterium]|jgi:dTDP-4-dehydrorhamnose reductase